MSLLPAHTDRPPTGTVNDARTFFVSRDAVRADFLKQHLPRASIPVLLGEDWGTRRYYRLRQNDTSYVLMEAVPAHLPFATLGHRIADFIKLAEGLRAVGLHAPAIYAVDENEGYVLLEDMGDVRVWDALEAGESAASLYESAVDVLIHLEKSFPDNHLALPTYDDSYIHAARRRLVDWYIPALKQAVNPDGLVEEYLAAWSMVEQSLPPAPMGVVHGDYHLQNLMWLPAQAGIMRCGLLDFQDAMWGPLPYDLANLLDDIRRDVPDDLRGEMIGRRTQGMAPAEKESFMAWYPVLALEFHCRIVGQVIRLALVQGKTGHLKNLPRVQAHVKRGLDYPVMAPLKNFMEDHAVTFDARLNINSDTLKTFIRSDAF